MSADRTTPALEVAEVTHDFGRRRALDHCTFTVPAGAVTALVGRNGAGKSTLLRAAAGLLRPDGGEVRCSASPPVTAHSPGSGTWPSRHRCIRC